MRETAGPEAGRIPFALPFIGAEEEEAVLRVLRSGWLTTGKEALAFEEEFASFLASAPETPSAFDRQSPDHQTGGGLSSKERPHCLAVNSATSGLHLAMEALGVEKGDIVLLPSYTFTSTAEVVRYLGAESVFVDIAPDSFNIDPEALEETIIRVKAGKAVPGLPAGSGKRIKALAVVHYGGLPCDMEAVLETARRHGLAVVEDAAHAFPAHCEVGGEIRAAGTIGDVGVFSFYATKTITTGEGGMIATNNAGLAKRMSVMRSHGIDRPVWNRYTDAKASWYYEVTAPGFKYNLPDLLAAIGRVQLGRARDLLARRQTIARRYDGAFGVEEGLAIPPSSPYDARHLYPLRLKKGGEAAGPSKNSKRDIFIENLQNSGIGVSVHFIPLHIMPYYRERYNLAAEDFPESLKRFRETVSLPIWPGMSGGQAERVISAVLEAHRVFV